MSLATILKQIQDGRVFVDEDHLRGHAITTIRGAIIDFIVREQRRATCSQIPDRGMIPESQIWELLPDNFFECSEEQIIFSMRLEGYIDREIAVTLGHSQNYVSKLRRQIGIRYDQHRLRMGDSVHGSNDSSAT